MVSRNLVGHDRSGVGIDQDDLDALFPKGSCGLGACIVKFTRLANDDGATADD